MPLGYVNFFKSCALPPSLLFYALFLSPVWAHDVASTIFWRDNSENSWPLGEKYCIISSPSIYSGLHLPCFLQHVQQWHLSVNPLRWETGTQCLLEVHLLVQSLQRQLDFWALVVQWLRLSDSTAGEQVQALVRKLRSCMPFNLAKNLKIKIKHH